MTITGDDARVYALERHRRTALGLRAGEPLARESHTELARGQRCACELFRRPCWSRFSPAGNLEPSFAIAAGAQVPLGDYLSQA